MLFSKLKQIFNKNEPSMDSQSTTEQHSYNKNLELDIIKKIKDLFFDEDLYSDAFDIALYPQTDGFTNFKIFIGCYNSSAFISLTRNHMDLITVSKANNFKMFKTVFPNTSEEYVYVHTQCQRLNFDTSKFNTKFSCDNFNTHITSNPYLEKSVIDFGNRIIPSILSEMSNGSHFDEKSYKIKKFGTFGDSTKDKFFNNVIFEITINNYDNLILNIKPKYHNAIIKYEVTNSDKNINLFTKYKTYIDIDNPDFLSYSNFFRYIFEILDIPTGLFRYEYV